jgi:serine protease
MLSRSPLLSIFLCAVALAAATAPLAMAAETTSLADGASSALAGVSGGVVVPSEATRERYRAREVVVRYGGAHASRAGALPMTRVVKVPRGQTVASYASKLRKRAGVLSATANYVAHVSGWVPPDPGNAGVPAGWAQLQWNFMPETGVDAPDAWQHLLNAGRPGGAGVVVAVVDTGIAYSNRGLRQGLRLRGRGQLSQRRQRPRDARRGHDRRGHGQQRRADGARVRGEADAGEGARSRRRG